MTCALFDFGATQSFVSASFTCMCNLLKELLPQTVIVTIPYGSIAKCTQAIKSCPISIGERIMEADLIIFIIMVFDLILGMDWLSKHYAKIDC